MDIKVKVEENNSPKAHVERDRDDITIVYGVRVLKGEPGTPGAPGEPGAPGIDGTSPKLTASRVGDTVTVYADGLELLTIKDGHTQSISAIKRGKETTLYVDGAAVAVVNDGEDGKDGASPTVTATKSGKVTSIFVNGVQIATINDGEKGEPGGKGEPGHTPTNAELTALINAQGYSKFSGSYNDLTNKPTIPTTPAQVGAAPASHTHEASEVGSFAPISFTNVANCYVDNGNGNQISYNGWSATDFVDIQGKSVRVSWGQTSSWNAWYDSAKKFISGFSASTSQTLTPPANAKYVRLSNTNAGMASLSIKMGASLDDVLDTKQDAISDLTTIRLGASLGATALQSFTETDPTVPAWAKQTNKPVYTASEVGAATSDHNHDGRYLKSFTETDPTVPAWAKASSKPTYTASEVGALPADTELPQQKFFVIHENDCTIATDATKGVAPYSTSYGYTNVTISPDAGVEWVEGAFYTFVINTKLIVASATRNVRVRIGEDDSWHPVMGYYSSILGGSSYFVKAMTVVFQYKSVYQSVGALHLQYDANTTYAYLVNTVIGDATSSPIKIDSTGYGARYSLIFPTTVDRTTWSSLVKSSGTGTTKVATPCTFYAQDPMYIYSANVAAGAKPINSVYQYYQAMDLRYTANTSSTYLPAYDRAFLWLKDFNPADKTFKADATVGNVVGGTKLGTRFVSDLVEGDVYLYWLGYTTATWYQLNPLQVDAPRIWKYTPATDVLVPWVQSGFSGSYNDLTDKPTIPDAVTDAHINSLIDAKLGEIENGTY